MLKLSREQFTALCNHLVRLGEGKVTPLDLSMGVCNEIQNLLWTSYTENPESLLNFVRGISRNWKYFSGHLNFPVPVSRTLVGNAASARIACESYHDLQNLWEGEYGELRREFCLFIVDELNKLHEKVSGR